MAAEPFDRFRSFAERYLIARANRFRDGHEQQDAWLCIQDAKRIYGMIAQANTNTGAPLWHEECEQRLKTDKGNAGR